MDDVTMEEVFNSVPPDAEREKYSQASQDKRADKDMLTRLKERFNQ